MKLKSILAAISCLAIIFAGSPANAAGTGGNWGLDRIDQHYLPLDGNYTEYLDANGIVIFNIDSGARATHTSFGGRVVNAANFAGGVSTDCYGHGTATTGVMAASDVGVAHRVSVVEVKVTDCAGNSTATNFKNALDWIAANYKTYSSYSAYLGKPGNVLISTQMAYNADSTVDAKVNSMLALGFPIIASAGNGSQTACNFSPARVPGVITVGSTNSNDQLSSFSNNGSCVDLFAPGEIIYTLNNTSDTAHALWSGTSFSAPFVSGIAAIALSCSAPTNPVTFLQSYFAGSSATTAGVVTGNLNGAPNRLAYRHVGWCP